MAPDHEGPFPDAVHAEPAEQSTHDEMVARRGRHGPAIPVEVAEVLGRAQSGR